MKNITFDRIDRRYVASLSMFTKPGQFTVVDAIL